MSDTSKEKETKMLKLEDLKDMPDEELISHIVSSYEVDEATVRKYEFLVAYESVGSYGCDSSSFFIMKNKETGSLAWNFGGHCSCYGFEGQFEPEDMPDAWFVRDDFYISTGGYDDNSTANELAVRQWIKENIKKGTPDANR